MKNLQKIFKYSCGIILLMGGFSALTNAQTETKTTINLQIVAASTPLSIPIIQSPANNSIQTGLMLFSRSNSAEYSGQQITYTWIVSRQEDFSSIITIQDTTNTELIYNTSNLSAGKYYRKILATNNLGSGHFSDTNSFCNTSCQNGFSGGGSKNTTTTAGEITTGNTTTTTTSDQNTENLLTLIEDEALQQTIYPLPNISTTESKQFTQEQISAYQYAYSLGITTKPSITQANIQGTLIRKDLAKMISEYAIKVLDKKPDNSIICTFDDTINQDLETQYYTKLACKLGLMGRHADGLKKADKFNPLEEVTRAQFSTIFSRLLYGGIYNVKPGEQVNRYTKHLEVLNKNNIIKKIDTPLAKELRGRVMTMMMRADSNASKRLNHASAK